MKKQAIIFTFVILLLCPCSRCFSDSDENPMSFSLSGAVEFESFINTYEDQDFEDAIKKNEFRGRFRIKYGLRNTYLFTITNIYLLPDFLNHDDTDGYYFYSDETTVSRNLQGSTKNCEIMFNELYLNHGEGKYRFRIGNQIYAWGTADTFNPTSYFNPMDVRELLFKDMDEMNLGVPSVSGMFFLDKYTLEMVVAPIHIPMQYPLYQTFWSPKLDEDLYHIRLEEGQSLDISVENVAMGARLSTNIFDADMSFSVFHGPDKEGVARPYDLELLPNDQVTVLVRPEYHIINMVGMDFAKSIGSVSIQFEAAYSNNKPAMVDQDFDDVEDIVLPIEIRETQFIAANLGFNYFVPLTKILEFHEGESVLICEYAFSKHFDDEVLGSFLSDLITVVYRDSFYESQISITLATTFDAESGSTLFYPMIGYDFMNGLTVSLAYGAISGESTEDELTDPVFYYFRNNDVITWKIRYEF